MCLTVLSGRDARKGYDSISLLLLLIQLLFILIVIILMLAITDPAVAGFKSRSSVLLNGSTHVWPHIPFSIVRQDCIGAGSCEGV